MFMHKLQRLFHIMGVVFLGVLLLMFLINIFRRNIYDPKLGINLLLIGKDGMGVISIRAGSGLISQMKLPDNLSIDVESNDADYQVEAIYKIGLPVNDPLNSARVSVGRALGVVLSGVIKAPVNFGISGLRESLFDISSKSNLSLIDRYLLLKDINEKLSNRASLMVALPKNVIDTVDEPDGKKIGKLNTAVFVWSKNQWVVDEVLSETAEVTVVNASGREGKARQVARQIESSGVRVIELLAGKVEKDSACLILGNTKAHPITMELLTNFFLCRSARDLNLLDFVDRDVKSDLVVILGKQN